MEACSTSGIAWSDGSGGSICISIRRESTDVNDSGEEMDRVWEIVGGAAGCVLAVRRLAGVRDLRLEAT
jgi:hypothetical protein